jgi:hypothetical protein
MSAQLAVPWKRVILLTLPFSHSLDFRGGRKRKVECPYVLTCPVWVVLRGLS